MSSRKFCDICEKEAIQEEEYPNIDIHTDPSPQYGKIKTAVLFRFSQHPSGYDKSPDLCKACIVKLIKKVLKKAQRNAQIKEIKGC